MLPAILLPLVIGACSLATTSSTLELQVPATISGNSNGSSLQSYLCGAAELSSDTALLLAPGEHIISEDLACTVADVDNLAIIGADLEASRVVCAPGLHGANFIFLNITNLTIHNVQVEGCGRVLPTDLPPYVNNTIIYIATEQRATFVFSLVTDLLLSSVEIMRSLGYSIIGVNLRGNTTLHNIVIADTDNYRHPLCHGNETDLSCSGSGAVFIYSDPLSSEEFLPGPTTILLRDSNITRNGNVIPVNQFIPVFLSFRGSYTLDRLLLTGATAMGVYFGQTTYDVDIRIVSSTVTDNTGYSSALGFLLFNTIRTVAIEIDDCLLEGNEGYVLARGGGIIVLVITYISELGSFPEFPPDTHNLLTVRNSSILNNFADVGGGGYFFFTPQNVTDIGIVFQNVIFNDNRAGIAPVFEVDTRPATFTQKNIHILLEDVTASGNILPGPLSFTATSDSSAAFVFLDIFNVTVSGKHSTRGSVFSNNSPGAFLVVGGQLYLQGKVEFYHNNATRGGALSLYDFALLFVFEGSRIKFSHNSAEQVGGAIYANSPGTGNAPTCVFQVIGTSRVFSVAKIGQLDLRMKFINNKALEGGNSIYANPLYGCASLPESSLVDISIVYNSSFLYNALFEFQASVSNGLSEISSVPEHICICPSGEVNISNFLCTSNSATTIAMTVAPGEGFTLYLYPVDLMRNPVSSILIVDIKSKYHSLGLGQAFTQLRGGQCTAVFLNLYGPEYSNTSLFLHTQTGTSPLVVDVSIDVCPTGFLSDDDDEGTISCMCDPYVTDVIGSSCNFTTYTISNPGQLWVGKLEHINFSDVVYVRRCPIGLCNRNSSFVDLTMEDQLCQPGRTGVLCGACKANLSVVFGSANCMECSNFWLFSIILYAVAGLLLVLFLFFLNFTVAQGSINGVSVIFFVNLLSVNSNILFPASNRGFLFIWLSIFNLELGFPMCFYDGMTEVPKAGLQCVFPTYLLLLCLAIIVLSRHSNVVAKLVSSHGIQVLATLIYLSYSKMLRLVIDILTYATLRSEEENHIIWLYDGNMQFFKESHMGIVIFPAAVTLVIVVIFTVAMVLIKQIQRHSSRLKPLLDAYGGPFKDPFRYWFGLRLVILIVMSVTVAVIGTDSPILSIVIQLSFLVVFMVGQAFLRPFRSQVMNAIDLFFMLDLFFILFSTVKLIDDDVEEQNKVVNTLVSLAFIAFLLMLLYHVYRIPVIRRRLEPRIRELKEFSFSQIASSVCRCCRRAPQEKGEEGAEDGNSIKLTSVSSLQDGGSSNNTTNSSLMSRGISTTTEVSLDGCVDADQQLQQRRVRFSQFRESILDNMDT